MVSAASLALTISI